MRTAFLDFCVFIEHGFCVGAVVFCVGQAGYQAATAANHVVRWYAELFALAVLYGHAQAAFCGDDLCGVFAEGIPAGALAVACVCGLSLCCE